ncbi:hypothetical protein [Anaerohalosphaera lusitana]|nr:hypothetical protein [Anaerohalosphaera lusitana]
MQTALISYALWWLILRMISRFQSLTGFLLFLFTALIVTACNLSGDLFTFMQMGITTTFLGLIFWSSHAIARLICRKYPTRLKFALTLAVSLLVISLLLCVAYYTLLMSRFMGFRFDILLGTFMVSLVVSGILFGGILPFLLIAFFTDFYYTRFKEFLGVEDKTYVELAETQAPDKTEPAQKWVDL